MYVKYCYDLSILNIVLLYGRHPSSRGQGRENFVRLDHNDHPLPKGHICGMYRVFLGAPSSSEILKDPSTYSWSTISSTLPLTRAQSPFEHDGSLLGVGSDVSRLHQHKPTQSFFFPPGTLEAASYRISLIYKNVLFQDDDEELEGDVVFSQLGPVRAPVEPIEIERVPTQPAGEGIDESMFCRLHFESCLLLLDQTTLYTWPPTAEASKRGSAASEHDFSEVGESLPVSKTSVLEDSLLASQPLESQGPTNINAKGPTGSLSRIDLSIFNASETSVMTYSEMFDTTEESFGGYSDASSIALLPRFHFSLHNLISLSHITSSNRKVSSKVSILLGILEVDGPDVVKLRKGSDAGKEVAILKLILGAEDGSVCRLTAWREVAEEWGGDGTSPPVKKGDIVLLESKS